MENTRVWVGASGKNSVFVSLVLSGAHLLVGAWFIGFSKLKQQHFIKFQRSNLHLICLLSRSERDKRRETCLLFMKADLISREVPKIHDSRFSQQYS